MRNGDKTEQTCIKYIANESVYTRARLQVKSNMGMRVQKPEDKQQVTAELDK